MKKGFTLIELLSVIVILAIILIIAVPRIMNAIDSSRKNSFLSSVKLITRDIETRYETGLAINSQIPLVGNCPSDVKGVNEFSECTYKIIDGTAYVSATGSDSGSLKDILFLILQKMVH